MNKNTDWQVENFRVTAFLVNSENINSEDLWNTSIGEEPDTINIEKGKLDTREVKYKNGRLMLIKQPDRVEWRYLSKPESIDDIGLPIIGNLESELNVITELTHKWLSTLGESQLYRLAFGAVLLKPVETVEAGFEYLQQFLPRLDFTNLSDFFYQVNRRRKSHVVDNLHINRLTKWNVIRLNKINFTVNPVNVRLHPEVTANATRLELDINTSQEITEPLQANLIDLFDELVNMGLDLAEKGDI